MLTQLSEDDRELIRLRYIADLPLKDIAQILNLNLIAVRVLCPPLACKRVHEAEVDAAILEPFFGDREAVANMNGRVPALVYHALGTHP